MIFGLLVMITALSISAVAIYYSVSGLVAIFAAAAIPIMVMGSVLEIGKLVTAVWLHRYWHKARWWLKTYLSIATVILMFITSMGIFGFLSKAHIEQTAAAQEGIAQIARIEAELDRQDAIIARAEQRIAEAEASVGAGNAAIQEQIDREQERIDTAYDRIQPAIDEQTAIIEAARQLIEERIQPLVTQANTIELTLANLSTALANNEVRVAQGIVGARQDGALGPNTSAKIQDYRLTEEAKRTSLLAQIEQIRTAPQTEVEAARLEIARIRASADTQIAQSNSLIQSLRDSLTIGKDAQVEAVVAEQQQVIIEANNIIDTLTQQKYSLQAEYRKLEAEVGPVKYLAEFIYGDQADQNILEDAVRWVIVTIIFVFDPLAVLLLIASQATFEMRRQEYPRLTEAKEKKTDDEIDDNINDELTQSGRDSNRRTDTSSEDIPSEPTIDIPTYAEWIRTDNDGGDMDGSRRELHFFLNEEQQDRVKEIEQKEQDVTYSEAKKLWKADHPEQTIKEQKELYIQGKIDELPWEGYIQNSEQNDNSIWNKIKNKT